MALGAIEFTDEQLGFLIPKHVKRIDPHAALDLRGDDAYEAFRDVRFSFNDGKPHCPFCDNTRTIYECRAAAYRRSIRYRCASCGKDFSVTSKTAFRSRKLEFNVILASLAFSIRGSLSTIMELADETGMNYRTAWRFSKMVRPFAGNARPRLAEQAWPYMPEKKAIDGAALVLAVNAAVPKTLPEQVRADVCQDLIVGVLSGDITESELKPHIQAYIRKHFNTVEPKLFDISFDEPNKNGDGEGYFADRVSYQRWLGQTPAY